MAALVVLEREGPAVTPPVESSQVERVGEERVVDIRLLQVVDVEERRLLQVEHVARLGIEALEIVRLHLVGRRRHHVAHHALVSGSDSPGGEIARVRGPVDRLPGVRVALGSVATERDTAARIRPRIADPDVVVVDPGDALPVGRWHPAAVREIPRATSASAAATATGPGAGRSAGTGVLRQRARVRGGIDGERDRLVVARERVAVEWQGHRRELPPGHRAECRGESIVIERGSLDWCLTITHVHQHEGVPTRDRLAVQQAGVARPRRRFDGVNDQSAVLRLQAASAVVVGGGDRDILAVRCRGKRQAEGGRHDHPHMPILR